MVRKVVTLNCNWVQLIGSRNTFIVHSHHHLKNNSHEDNVANFVFYQIETEHFLLFAFLSYVCFTGALDSKFSDESDDLADEGITGPERGYRGPHLVFPLQKKDIDTLIELFRKKKV